MMNRSFAIAAIFGIYLTLATSVSAEPDVTEIEIPGLSDISTDARPLRVVRIPAGSFQMGDENPNNFPVDDERPVHTVDLDYDFHLGETEVTQAQWQAVMGYQPTEIEQTGFGEGPNYPVYGISWYEVAASDGFLDRLSALAPGTFYLPAEAEWEYACRAGTQTRFSFGDSGCVLDQNDCFSDGSGGFRSNYMWFAWSHGSNGHKFACKPVAALAPNQFGLYDMHGNLWEWCEDWYAPNYEDASKDGSPHPTAEPCYKVFRGGHWGDMAWYCRSSVRGYCDPTDTNPIRGFRVLWQP